MAAIQVNMRVPEVLLARINAAAGDDRTKWILEACRMRLDAGNGFESHQPRPAGASPKGCDTASHAPAKPNVDSPEGLVSEGNRQVAAEVQSLPSGFKPDMQALRDICA